MNLDLPQEMLVVTRESAETDKFFSVFGLDYENTMSEFNSANIYLEGMYEDSSKVFTVTMVSDENSKSIGNYNKLNDDQLIEVEDSFLSAKEYSSCTIQRYNDYVFMDLQFATTTDGETVYASQCNTVVDGKNITLTLQPAKGSELTNTDYQIMNEILQSVVFSDRNTHGVINLIEEPGFWFSVIGGVLLIAIIIIVIMVIKRRKNHNKVKKTEKKIKNQEIIQELAQEFSSRPTAVGSKINENIEFSSEEEVDSDYIPTDSSSYKEETAEEIIEQLRGSNLAKSAIEKDTQITKEETAEKIYTPTQKYDISDQELSSGNIHIDEHQQENVSQADTDNIPLKAENGTVLKIVTPNDEAGFEGNQDSSEDVVDISEVSFDNTSEYDQDDDVRVYDQTPEYDEDYDDELDEDYDDELDEDYDDELDEEQEVIGSEESFEQSEDYFDEGLDEDVYSRDNIDDEDEYEKTRKPVINPEVAKIKAKTAGAVILNGFLIFLNGVKSFFIHLGYFFVNVVRLIKRSHKKRKAKKIQAKKRKQQEEAQRRKQENARRKQERIRQQEAGGLVKVRSSKTAPSGKARPTQNPSNRKKR